MEDGVVGLYKNQDGIVYCTIREGDAGLPLEEILPAGMRGPHFADAPIGPFLNTSYLFFATSAQWEEWWADVQPGVSITKPPPEIDPKALKLETADGQIDYDRLRELYSLIWPYWDKQPPIGLIAHCISWELPQEEIARLLERHDRYGDKIEHFNKVFAEIFMPPDLARQGGIVSDAQLQYALRWCRRPDGGNELSQEELLWTLNFRELGIVGADGRLNRRIAAKARDFIWGDPDREPDYFALKAHLEPHLPKQERAAAKPSQKTLPKTARDKLKKQKRKAGRVRRRRR